MTSLLSVLPGFAAVNIYKFCTQGYLLANKCPSRALTADLPLLLAMAPVNLDLMSKWLAVPTAPPAIDMGLQLQSPLGDILSCQVGVVC